MRSHQIEQKLRIIIKEKINFIKNVDKITLDDNLIDFGLDSHSEIMLTIAIETQFKIKLPYETLNQKNVWNLRHLIALINKTLA
jgi:acyl carrier protein